MIASNIQEEVWLWLRLQPALFSDRVLPTESWPPTHVIFHNKQNGSYTDYCLGAVLGISLVGSIGSMMGAIYTSPENTVQKHLFWIVRTNFLFKCKSDI